MGHSKLALALFTLFAYHVSNADAFWRMVCGLIQTGRLDPVVSPNIISGHVHKVSGASNFNFTSDFASLQASSCTSCEIQADKSAYWTPQLYYEHANGTFEDVPNGGTVVYYLGRGANRTNIEPFPPGFKMLSGDMTLRANDTTARTYADPSINDPGRLVSDRVSFACLDSSGGIPEQNYMFRTDCDDGMRAQIHFQSCWDGRDYQTDQSHVAYMSQIDNGVCPPSHPRQLIHLFFEVIYSVNSIKKDGGRFVFAQGDPTGFGFHGDFINGWDPSVLQDAVTQCVNNDTINGQISLCPPLAMSDDPYYDTNCPERAPIINETVKGSLPKLPGCNPVVDGPARAAPQTCPGNILPSINYYPHDHGSISRFSPTIGQPLGAQRSWTFAGCANENGGRLLNGAAMTSVNMTIEICTQFCKTEGFQFAGNEYSDECYCGSSIGAANETGSCAGIPLMACAGNLTEWCGAPSLLTIWKDTAYTATTLVPGATTLGNHTATYVGCFTDPGGNNRALKGASETNTTSMTNELCVAYCKNLGFQLAGTEYAQECYCGNVNTGTAISDVTQCNARCKGDGSEYCGGSNKMSIWNITKSSSSSSSSSSVGTKPETAANGTAIYMHCYGDDNANGRTLSAASYSSSSAMTVDACASFCQARNYAFFGVEYGQECYCGNTIASTARTYDDDDDGSACVMPCSGDATQKCGGSSRLGIWNNTLYAPTRNLQTFSVGGASFAYLGCYAEGTGGRALGSTQQASSSSSGRSAATTWTTDGKLTVEECGGFCAGEGFAYMGVEYGGECYCNSEGPVNGAARASEGDCNMTCDGDAGEWCGGGSRISVYKSGSA